MKRHSGMLVAGLVALAASAQTSTGLLRLERSIALPGVEGRIDHLAVDLAGNRLFVAALGNNTLEVIDLAAAKRVHSIGDLHEPQGLVYLPEQKRLFVANGEDGKLQAFDVPSFQPVHAVDFSEDADNVRYDSRTKHIYVGYGKGALGVVEATAGKKIGRIPLDGHPESFQLEQAGARIFVNVPTAGHVAVADRHSRAVVAKWALDGNQANFPMALDEAHHRLFVGCRKPARILVFDTASGKIATSFACVGDADDLFYDAARKRIYVSGGEGFISVFRQEDADHYDSVAKIPTAAGARTALFVPELKRLYLAVPHRGDQGAEIRVYEALP